MEDILIGKFGKPHGIKGWVKVRSYAEPPEKLFHYPTLHIKTQQGKQSFSFTDFREHSQGYIGVFEENSTRDNAEDLRGLNIYVSRNQLGETDNDEYFQADLIGMEVFSISGTCFGQLKGFIEAGTFPVMEIEENIDSRQKEITNNKNESKEPNQKKAKLPGKKNRVLIPWATGQEIVQSVDIESKKIIVDWDEDY